MHIRESFAEASLRFDTLAELAAHYDTFDKFLADVIQNVMGFTYSDIQIDIGNYLEYGPKYMMIQAQRGQAKTTITAAYAVWCLIHTPSFRVLIISSGGTMAREISGWIIQIINGMDVLECMRPDRSAGDRSSVEAFDIHYSLKGPEKSPSIACVGITSNLQGKRADLLIADDVESTKNALTDTQRSQLLHLTLDFTSICSTGKIVYLGTPQSIDSIYNTLPSRGYTIRIWPGRYPTLKEEGNYGGHLAPLLVKRMEMDPSLRTGGGPTGDRGQPIDPVLLDEDTLTKKEIDQGPAYFQLQHMLDTRLSDENRFPLKLDKLVFMNIPTDRAPVIIDRIHDKSLIIPSPSGHDLKGTMYRAAGYSGEFMSFTETHMYIDPAGGGQNGDETGIAVSKFLAANIFLVDSKGIPGGSDDDKLDLILDKATHWKVNIIQVEQNFGHGMFSQMLRKRMSERSPKAVQNSSNNLKECIQVEIEDVFETGQKELRIIGAIEPVQGSYNLIVEEDLIASDWADCQKYSASTRSTYSLFWQLSRITRDKKSLRKDDRLDAVHGTIKYWSDQMDQDKSTALEKAGAKAFDEMVNKTMHSGRSLYGPKNGTPISAFSKFGLKGKIRR